ncbi:MAG: hypothetical protein ACLGPL_03310 [Acidobacteriota bacterium]
MIEAVKFWNEPDNLSHWDFTMDPEWKEFTHKTCLAAEAVRAIRPDLTLGLERLRAENPEGDDSRREPRGPHQVRHQLLMRAFPQTCSFGSPSVRHR